MARKFETGQKYSMTSWFTGGWIAYTVSSIKGKKIELKTVDCELDGIHERYESYDIQKRENGDEFIILFVYNGVSCMIEALEVGDGGAR